MGNYYLNQYLTMFWLKKLKKNLFFLILGSFLISFTSSSVSKISLSMEMKTLRNKKYVKALTDVFYDYSNDKIVMHYTYPFEQMIFTNKFGETKIYNPKNNTVFITQDQSNSTQGTFIYHFLAKKIQDMGLKDLGFKLKDTKFENQYMVTRWVPPLEMADKIGSIKLVHKDYLPVFMEYKDNKLSTLKKTYYTDYKSYTDINIPMKITDINFFGDKDSSITRVTINNVNLSPNSSFFNYTIPTNAKNISGKK